MAQLIDHLKNFSQQDFIEPPVAFPTMPIFLLQQQNSVRYQHFCNCMSLHDGQDKLFEFFIKNDILKFKFRNVTDTVRQPKFSSFYRFFHFLNRTNSFFFYYLSLNKHILKNNSYTYSKETGRSSDSSRTICLRK